MIQLKTRAEIDVIARGGAIISDLFGEVGGLVRPGISTGELNRLCDDFICSHEGATPAFKGLYGFPGSVCTSVNEEVVHGIPRDDRVLVDGDIVSMDVGVRLDGWCSDSAWTFAVGTVDEETQRLLSVTQKALDAAVGAAIEGQRVGDIGAAVEGVVHGTGLAIIRDLVGHGVGRDVHEEPQVPNYGRAGQGPLLREGMVLAIEPMLAIGTERIRTLDDRWTVITADRTRAAHYEHTVAVLAEGPRILTGVQDPVGVE